MKRIKVGLLFLMTLLLVACEEKAPLGLEGKWQLQTVESEAGVISVDTVYYNFQNTLFMYQVYQKSSDSFIYQYGYNVLEEDNQLRIQLEHDPRPVDKFLPYTDWSANPCNFTVERVNHKQLILNSEGKRYLFRKF